VSVEELENLVRELRIGELVKQVLEEALFSPGNG